MNVFELSESGISRRRFLKQSFAFSAMAAMGVSRSFASVKIDPKAAEILMVGDWGYEQAEAQTLVAKGMVSYAKANKLKTQALLMLGDNWYGPLPGGVNSDRWKTAFEDLYPASVFDCPAYAILGNHDYQRMPEDKVVAELEYAKKPGTRWTMPSRWYSFEFPKKKPLVKFIALDSNMTFPDGKWDRGENYTLTPELKAEQLEWFKAELEKPKTTPFLVVMGHHPVYSDGPHGDHRVLIRDWDPLLKEHKVDAYLAGHDHDLQHLEFEGHPTSFFLSGGGGADLYNLKIQPEVRGPYAQKVHGFSRMSVTEKTLTLQHLDADGKLVHALERTAGGGMKIL